MSWVQRALSGLTPTARATTTLAQPADWFAQALTGGGSSVSGQTVTVGSALGLAPFWRGVQILSGSVGMLPLKVYARRDGSRIEVPSSSRPWSLLHDKPNTDQAADEFWALVESHIDTWGNAFIWKEKGADGRVANLWALEPSRVTVGRTKEGVRYFVLDGNADNPFFDVDILHIRGLGSNGLVGYSPVTMHRHALGTAQARDEFGGRFWDNDATPGVVLIHERKLEPAAVERIRALWDARHKGGLNRRRTAVLGEGVQVHQMTMPLRDAQYIEGQRMDATTQALILGIPPYMVAGDTGGGSMTYSTVEGQSVDFLKWTLSSRLVRIQNAVSWDPDLMPSNWFAEFSTGGILRSTTKERYEAWAIAPHLTVDEMRGMDNLPPLPDGAGLTLSKSSPVAPTDPAITVGGTSQDEGGEDGN